MRIAGVDPGFANLGLGAIEASSADVRFLHGELIRTRGPGHEGARLATLFDATCAFLEAVRPAALAIEDQFFGRQLETALKVGQALGVVRLAAHRLGVPTFAYGPSQVKQALVGTGRADKAQVAFMVRALLGLTSAPRQHHVADALALALTHWSAHRISAAGESLRAAASPAPSSVRPARRPRPKGG